MKSIHSALEVELLSTRRDFALAFAAILAVFCASIALEFYHYKTLIATEKVRLESAKVLLQYKKPEKPYFVLKLRDENGAIFYTTSREDLRFLQGRFVNLYGKLGEDCDFLGYLKSCFVIGFDLSLTPKIDFRTPALDFIAAQHGGAQASQTEDSAQDLAQESAQDSPTAAKDSAQDLEQDSRQDSPPRFTQHFAQSPVNLAASLYQNIFLAAPSDPRIREVTATLGIAHIFAISGFHLGILAAFLYFVLKLPYRALQVRYFTHRNEFYDLNFIVLIFAFFYLIVLDFSPSFLRSFVMFALGFWMLFCGIKLLSFRFLALCALFCVALFPRVAFSVGFLLSVSGVFYIYLFLRHFGGGFSAQDSAPKPLVWLKKAAFVLAFNFALYLQMLPLSHYFFYAFSPFQLLSPLITIAFVVFYPAALMLHILGLGGAFDGALYAVLGYDFSAIDLRTSALVLAAFAGLSIAAVFSKKCYFALTLSCILYFCFGIYEFLRALE